MSTSKLLTIILIALIFSILSACGGGSGNNCQEVVNMDGSKSTICYQSPSNQDNSPSWAEEQTEQAKQEFNQAVEEVKDIPGSASSYEADYAACMSQRGTDASAECQEWARQNNQ